MSFILAWLDQLPNQYNWIIMKCLGEKLRTPFIVSKANVS